MTAAHLQDLARFVEASPSSFHAVAEAGRRLDAAGFTQLQEADDWSGSPGKRKPTSGKPTAGKPTSGKHYVIRDGAIIAWIRPAAASATTPFRILGAHTDSPGFKLKPKPTIGSEGWLQAGVEVYGGPLLNSWLDRELELAGRIAFADGTTSLVRTGPFLRFPQLAIHLDREVNDGLTLRRQAHMNPIFGVGDRADADLLGHLAGLTRRRKATASDIVGYDISVADTATPSVFGLDDAFFASGRLDNLSSVHSGLTAFLRLGTRHKHIPMFAAFDHEEVGSATRSGASGPFLADILARVGAGLGASDTDRMRAFADSWCLSADAGHAVHPNYADRHDPANRPVLNRGPLLKINANQRYATDAMGAAEWARACAQAKVGYQEFVSHNDVPCGSTIGPLTATRLGIRTIDVGLPLLSMHSARELCGAEDPAAFTAAIEAFLAPA
jgi:aspartyl aminopeptidase